MRPAPALDGLVSGYHICSAGPSGSPVWEELLFPGWANIRLTLDNGGWHCGSVGTPMLPVPDLALFGPASRGIHSRTGGGLMVGAGITPLGWHRLFSSPAYTVADKIVPLDRLIAHIPHDLLDNARKDPSPDGIQALFDQWLTQCLRRPSALVPAVAGLFERLTCHDDVELKHIESALGLSASQLRRVARHHFGFPPKLLLRRTRFLKSIASIINTPDANWSGVIDERYFDYAHFIRDCQDFLGMAPRKFLALDRPMTRLSMSTRTEQLGSPMGGLQKPVADLHHLQQGGK
jgi:hypothetical protein